MNSYEVSTSQNSLQIKNQIETQKGYDLKIYLEQGGLAFSKLI